MTKKLITERDVNEIVSSGSKVLRIEPGSILTPAAKDAILQNHVETVVSGDAAPPSAKSAGPVSLTKATSNDPSKPSPVIVLGSDHGGYKLKETLKKYLADGGYTIADVGTDSEEACDYPDFAFAVAKMVESGQAVRGIMIDGVGVASAIVANKVPGIRAVPCYDEFVARSSREHNDANVLTLGGRIVGSELAKSIVKIWLDTPFAGGRHEGRVGKIRDVEQRYLKGK